MEDLSKDSALAAIRAFMAAIKDDLDGFKASRDSMPKGREAHLHASKLKRGLFKELNILETRRLGSAELHAFARGAFNYVETHSTWLKDVYFDLCVDVLRVDPCEGVHEILFAQLVDTLLQRGLESELKKCLKMLKTDESRRTRKDEATASRSTLSSIHWKELLHDDMHDVSVPLEQTPPEVEAVEPHTEPMEVATAATDGLAKAGMQVVLDAASRGSSVAGDDVSTTADNLSQPDSALTALTDPLVTASMEAWPPGIAERLAQQNIP
eukprot:6447123-Amphidinium_carterae.1